MRPLASLLVTVVLGLVLLAGGPTVSGGTGGHSGARLAGLGVARSESIGAYWTNVSYGTAPPARVGSAATYDGGDRYLLLFGGDTMGREQPLDDTWTYRGGVWANITASAGTPPSPRSGSAMAYDAADGYVLLAGGQGPSGTQLSDVWEFHAGRWSQLSSNGLPVSLQTTCGLTAAFDSTDNFTMFLAASCISGATGGTALAYRAGVWTDPDYNKTTGPKSPVPGYGQGALVDDPQWKGLVFFGGTDINGKDARSETVVYSAGNWTDESGNLTGTPQGQSSPSAAFDPGYPGVLVFGGFQPGPFGSPPPATWILDNSTWTNVSAGGNPPTEGGSGDLSWDAEENASIYFSGFANYTWSWGTSVPPPPLATNFTWHINYASCLSNGGVTNSVTLYANASGGAPPYTYAWDLPTGPGAGPVANTTLMYGTINTVTLAVTDSLGDRVTHSTSPAMELPPCPPPYEGNQGINQGSNSSAVVVALAGVTVGVIVASAAVLLFVYRKRQP